MSLGNKYLHHLSTSEPQELRVDLTDYSDHHAYAKYHNFSVGDSHSQYRLNIGTFTGTAGKTMNLFATHGLIK